MNKRTRIKKKQMRMKTKQLIKRYPFLAVKHWKTGKPYYDFTYLDDMPNGWRKAFGTQMCEEIRNALIKSNQLHTYRIAQIKEKFGGLRWYDYGATDEVYKIINKYEKLSYHVCMLCGRPAKARDNYGWTMTICDKCAGI